MFAVSGNEHGVGRSRFPNRHTVAGPVVWISSILVPVAGCALLMPDHVRTLAAFAVIGGGLAVLVGPSGMRSARR